MIDHMFYRLNGHTPMPCTMEEFLEVLKDDRRVAITPIGNGKDCTVSTVFLGVDVSDTPRLFETMVFGGPHDLECRRCSTWDEAIRQHFEMVNKLGAELIRKIDNE